MAADPLHKLVESTEPDKPEFTHDPAPSAPTLAQLATIPPVAAEWAKAAANLRAHGVVPAVALTPVERHPLGVGDVHDRLTALEIHVRHHAHLHARRPPDA